MLFDCAVSDGAMREMIGSCVAEARRLKAVHRAAFHFGGNRESSLQFFTGMTIAGYRPPKVENQCTRPNRALNTYTGASARRYCGYK